MSARRAFGDLPHRIPVQVEPLEGRRLLSFDPLTAGGFAQSGQSSAYLWAAGRNGANDSTFIENERLGYITETSYNMSIANPPAAMSDQPILDSARFELKSTNDALPIGTLTIRNSQAAWDSAESDWRTSLSPAAWERTHNDGFYLTNPLTGTNSVIVFQDVDITSIETSQSVLFDGGSAGRIYFRNCTWNDNVTIKVIGGASIGEVIFDNCQGNVNIQFYGGSLGTVYNTDPAHTTIHLLNGSAPMVNALPDDLAQPTSYGATPVADGTTPTLIEAENFDTHGEGVSFHDSSSELDSPYRPDLSNGGSTGSTAPRVDLASGGSNGYHVTGVRAGEWIDYTVDVTQGGMYRVDTLVNSPGTGGQIRVGFDGRYVRYNGVDASYYTLPDTNGAYVTMPSDAIYLSPGTHLMHVQFGNTAGAAADVGDFDSFTLVPVAAPGAAPAVVANPRIGNSNGDTYPGTRSTINFRWDASLAADGYVIQRSDDGIDGWRTVGELDGDARDSAGLITDFTDSGLAPDTTYFYRIGAYNLAGMSPWSAVVSFRTRPVPIAPAAPTNITVRQTAAGQFSFSWTDTSTNERSFKVEEWDGTQYDVVTGTVANGITAALAGLSDSLAYKFRVAAVNPTGQGYGPTIILPADAGFESGSLLTSWEMVGSATIINDGQSSAFAAQLSDGAAITQTLSNLSPNTTYTLHVAAKSAGGTLSLAAAGFGESFIVPGMAYGDATMTFTTGFSRSAAISLAATGGAVDLDDVQIVEEQPGAPVLAPPSTTSSSITLSWSMPGTTNLAGFEVWRSADGRNFTDITPTLLPPETQQFTDSWALLSAGSTFYYQVRAAQMGDTASDIGDHEHQPNFSPVQTVVMAHPPSPASNLQLVTIGTRTIELSWQNNVAGGGLFDAQNLLIERAQDGGAFEAIATLPTGVDHFTDPALPQEIGLATYHYRITAYTLAASAPPSAEAATQAAIPEAEPTIPPAPPSTGITLIPAPSNLTVDIHRKRLRLRFTDNAAVETGFRIYISTNNAKFKLLAIAPPSGGSSRTVTWLGSIPARGKHYYYVVAYNKQGKSKPSKTVRFKV